MKDKIANGLKDSMVGVIKQTGFWPFAYACAGLVLSSMLYFVFGLMEYGSLWLVILSLLIFAALCYVVFPLLYGVTLNVVDGCRFERKKHDIPQVFNSYYKGNRGVFGIFSAFWKTLLFFFLSIFVFGMIVVLIIRLSYSDLWNGLMEYMNEINNNRTPDLLETLGAANYRLFEVLSMLALSAATLCSSLIWGREIRKNESVFYCSTSLVAGNRINVASGQLIPLFRKAVMPVVKKEYFKYNMMINWPGYVVFILSYAGFVILGCFIPSIPSFLVPFLALVIACFLYSPFYYFARVFDDLFYIAYSDRIMDKLPPNISRIIEDGRSGLNQAYPEDGSNNDDDNNNDSNVYDAKPSDDDDKKNVLNGKQSDDGTIDFTSDKDKDSDDKDDKDKKD